jgi:Zn-dependent peptidase ImmA (M78 family)
VKSRQFDGLKVLIEEMLEAEGYDIFPVQGLNKYAEAYLPKRPKLVFVDAGQQLDQPLRYKFTVAEELAHILIGRRIFPSKTRSDVQEIFKKMNDEDYADSERNAKYLACCLLLPKQTFLKRFALHQERLGTDIVNPAEIAMRVIRALHSDFDVSKETIALRAKHLGLISEECLLGIQNS